MYLASFLWIFEVTGSVSTWRFSSFPVSSGTKFGNHAGDGLLVKDAPGIPTFGRAHHYILD